MITTLLTTVHDFSITVMLYGQNLMKLRWPRCHESAVHAIVRQLVYWSAIGVSEINKLAQGIIINQLG